MSNPRRRRRWLSLLVAALVLAGIALAVLLRAKAPPEAARLLPENDAILYAHLKPLRAAMHFDNAPGQAVHRSPDYQSFIDATGFVPERDLDSAALALHRLPDPAGPNGPVGYDEVFIGRFDDQRIARYLASLARSQETYAGRTIYSIPVEGRTLRVVQLGYDTIASSNMPTAEQIHSMLDRSRASALSGSGSSLLTARYHEVPLFSEVWGIGHIGLPFAQNGHLTVLGLELPLPEDTDLVASLRYQGSVHFRLEEIAPDALSAQHTVETLDPLLGILRGLAGAQPPHGPADTAMRQALSNAKLEQEKDRALLTTTISVEDVKNLLASGDQ